MKASLLTVVAGSVLLGACAEKPPEPPRPVPVSLPQKIGDYWYLDQNWTDAERQWYYSTTQGSQIMPYEWFMALPDSSLTTPLEQSYFHQDLTRYGYLAASKSGWSDGVLPVGFIKDTDPKDGAAWMGLTCAACHTGDWRVGDKTMRIDGSATTGDLYGLISGISDAVKYTLGNTAAFDVFSRRVLGPYATDAQRVDLHGKLATFHKEFATFVADSTPASPWGPMRTDAFQMIFNRVGAIDLKIPSNSVHPNAPVSFPYLWDASKQPKAQWNGAVPNGDRLTALARNAGEVLGVFGKAALKAPPSKDQYYYNSTVRAKNLIWMEELVRELRSPVWPDSIAGKVDIVKASAGESIYKDNCESCHKVLPRDMTFTDTPIQMIPLFNWADKRPETVVDVFTKTICDPAKGIPAAVKAGYISVAYESDPTMAVDAACRFLKTGPIEGVVMPPIIGTALKKDDLAVNVLANAVTGSLIGTIIHDRTVASLLLDTSWTGAKDVRTPTPWDDPPVWKTETGAASASLPQPSVLVKDTRAFTRPVKGKPVDEAAQALLRRLKERTSPSSELASTAAATNLTTEPTQAVKDAEAKATKALAELIQSILAYKARPLDGVWATAPYMHNGSVPNLYEMLLPASQRSATFRLGTHSFEPHKVGVDQSANDNTFTFDTAKPGNHNTGHEFGASLTDEQRWQLLEYLKTL